MDVFDETISEMYNFYGNYGEIANRHNKNRRRRNEVPRRIIRDAANPFEFYTDENFRKRYRFRKDSCLNIIQLFENDLNKINSRGLPIPAMIKVLVALRFFATGSFQLVCADLFSVSQSSVCRIVKEVAFLAARQRRRYIVFPNAQNIRRNAVAYNEMYNFPGVIGCIDCTHVCISSRGGQIPEVYRNRHGKFSYNVQVISGPQLEILDIVASWAGSTHDARIFDNSRVRAVMESGTIPRGYVLLGDRGYPCRPYLLTPLANPTTVSENDYQKSHIVARNSVERTFGVWKKKFHCLSSVMAYKTQTLLNIIVGTAVLYNIGKNLRDNVVEEEEEENDPYEEDEPDVIAPDNAMGIAMRNAFIQRHFT